MRISLGESNFFKILVAVDFDDDAKLLQASRECVDEALQTAGQTVSSLVFVHVVNVPERLEAEVRSNRDTEVSRHLDKIRRALAELVAESEKAGTPARSVAYLGVPWFRLIQAVIDEKADLLMAGTGKPGSLWRALFGSTTMKLLRKCPCPVWVTKRPDSLKARWILVAHDLKEVGSKALAWGANLAQERGHHLTVLHVMDSPEFGRFWSSSSQEKAQRREAAKSRIEAELSAYTFSKPVDVIIEEGSPETLIHHYLQLLPVGLLVMGTVGRTGLSGFITGNTAETLLPLLTCALVAVKPDGFVTPVQSEPAESGSKAIFRFPPALEYGRP